MALLGMYIFVACASACTHMYSTYNVHVRVHVGVSSLICYVCTYFSSPVFML